MAHLERQGHSKVPFGLAVGACLFLVYFIQTGCYFFWTRIMLPNTFAGGLNDTYFAYVNALEFLFFIFIRTRLSLKYFAKFSTGLNVLFLVYVNSYMYSAQYEMLSILFLGTCLIFVTFLKIVEIPAMQ